MERFSGPDKGWKPAFLNPEKGAGGKQPDLWLIDGELPTSTGAASSLIKSSPLEKGCRSRYYKKVHKEFFCYPIFCSRDDLYENSLRARAT